MTSVFWFDVAVFSSFALNVTLSIALVILWFNTRKRGVKHAMDTGGVVYVVREGVGGDIRYVGITRNLERRIAEHTRRANYTTPFYQWFHTHSGTEHSPYFEVVEVCKNRSALADAEKKWIAKYKSSGKLLNATNGG